MTQHPLSLLCIEPRFPGRLGPVADWLVRKRGYRCQFYCANAASRAYWPASVGRGMDVIQFNVGGVARQDAAPWTRDLERAEEKGSGLNGRKKRGRNRNLGISCLLPCAQLEAKGTRAQPSLLRYFEGRLEAVIDLLHQSGWEGADWALDLALQSFVLHCRIVQQAGLRPLPEWQVR